MSLSAIIDALVAAGCTPEQIGAAVRAHESEEAAEAALDVPWLEAADKVFSRDGYSCAYCGKNGGSRAGFEIDHIVPRAKGGRDRLDNLTVACRGCNRSKKDRLLEEWRR